MTLEEYRALFTAVGFVLMLTAASPMLSLIVPFSANQERFSELWVLGPTRMVAEYPFNMTVGEAQQIFVGGSNHEGHSAHYVVYVRLRNPMQAAPNSTAATPSPLAPLYAFRTVVAEGAGWEVPVTFSVVEASRVGDLLTVERMSINDAVFAVDCSSLWDSDGLGFFYQLFFELWMYDGASLRVRYQNRFVSVWLNMTE